MIKMFVLVLIMGGNTGLRVSEVGQYMSLEKCQ